jgi:hypothetical protein
MQENPQQDIEQLIQYSIGFADELLNKHREFYPFASYISVVGELVPIRVNTEEEFPDSSELITELLEVLESLEESGELIAYAIAIDSNVTNDQYPGSTDAITVQTFHSQQEQQLNYYFPYRFVDEQLEILEGWGEINQ